MQFAIDLDHRGLIEYFLISLKLHICDSLMLVVRGEENKLGVHHLYCAQDLAHK